MDESVPKELMKTYLESLERGDYEVLVDQFTEDATYYHPILGESIQGRDAMLEFFKETRESRDGAHEVVHEFDKWVVSGNQFALAGRLLSPNGDTIFLAYGEVTDGKISYYVPALLNDIW